ncbi:PTS lactose/cellobiose transporter subunit IIA [Clostridium sp. SYSU_GA19001]|uniref:PTS lactose/cellobiose transporter subunit IIA n=1 Tax=Clostridium caldaquaticum TaxID=2940653 RepID=UPI0020779670|nr:PTS lactose/cellobiose transporter subunit IIA [Clostridium caldaquaticum]MCM8711532.1 PTS lactose/cellobiose transporter subunit IIA [Clostridium caldaquaticum]
MEGMELISFQIISAVGTARSLYIEAIQEAKKGNFERAEELIKEGSEIFLQGHHAHTQLIQQEANGQVVVPTLMLMHAEDQLMSADGFKIIAEEIIEVYKNTKK